MSQWCEINSLHLKLKIPIWDILTEIDAPVPIKKNFMNLIWICLTSNFCVLWRSVSGNSLTQRLFVENCLHEKSLRGKLIPNNVLFSGLAKIYCNYCSQAPRLGWFLKNFLFKNAPINRRSLFFLTKIIFQALRRLMMKLEDKYRLSVIDQGKKIFLTDEYTDPRFNHLIWIKYF